MKLTEILDKKFKAGHSFGGFVDYAEHSGTSVRGETFEDLKKDIHAQLIYYKDKDPRLGIIQVTCNACLGSGQLVSKINQRGNAIRYKKCPDCRGVGRIDFD